MQGGRFEGANRSDFSDAKTIHSIKTGETKIGLLNMLENPIFVYTDGTFLYGYYDPTFLEYRPKGEEMLNKCFEKINRLDFKFDDNCIIAKVALK